MRHDRGSQAVVGGQVVQQFLAGDMPDLDAGLHHRRQGRVVHGARRDAIETADRYILRDAQLQRPADRHERQREQVVGAHDGDGRPVVLEQALDLYWVALDVRGHDDMRHRVEAEPFGAGARAEQASGGAIGIFQGPRQEDHAPVIERGQQFGQVLAGAEIVDRDGRNTGEHAVGEDVGRGLRPLQQIMAGERDGGAQGQYQPVDLMIQQGVQAFEFAFVVVVGRCDHDAVTDILGVSASPFEALREYRVGQGRQEHAYRLRTAPPQAASHQVGPEPQLPRDALDAAERLGMQELRAVERP